MLGQSVHPFTGTRLTEHIGLNRLKSTENVVFTVWARNFSCSATCKTLVTIHLMASKGPGFLARQKGHIKSLGSMPIRQHTVIVLDCKAMISDCRIFYHPVIKRRIGRNEILSRLHSISSIGNLFSNCNVQMGYISIFRIKPISEVEFCSWQNLIGDFAEICGMCMGADNVDRIGKIR